MSRAFFLVFFIAALLAFDLYAFQGFKVLVKKWLPDHSLLLYVLYWTIPVVLGCIIAIKAIWYPSTSNNLFFTLVFSILIGLFIAKLIWVIFILSDDLIRGTRYAFNRALNSSPEQSISRSEFIITVGFFLASTLFGSLLYGIFKGAHNYTIKRRKISIKNLPEELSGLKIVQISDVHSGSFWNKKKVERGVDMIKKLEPDLFFFTGDLINNKADEFNDYKEMFSSISAKYGAYSVLGNHDYGDYVRWPDTNGITKSQNLENLKKHHKDMGWKLLLNENEVLEIKGHKLAILGVENWSDHKRFPKYGDLKKAMKGVEDVEHKLLLSHDPSHWRAQVLNQHPSISATFSGHTHGMQFGVDTKYYKWSPVKYQYPEWVDMYTEKGQSLYVNRGFGYLGYPGRFGFLPEITVFELQADIS